MMPPTEPHGVERPAAVLDGADEAVARHAARRLVERLRDPITGPVHAREAADVIEALLRERGVLRQRVSQAEKAMRTTVEDCRRQGLSFGRLLANYAAGMFERERDEARAKMERLRGIKEAFCYYIDASDMELSEAGITRDDALARARLLDEALAGEAGPQTLKQMGQHP